MKLFCLPYAGGSAIIYREWKPFFASNIELAPVEYAGHGKRIMHPLYKDVQAAVEDVYDMLLAAVANGRPYAIFGHSMGAMLAYEVAQKLRSNNKPLPKHIFFSGRGAPHISAEKYKIYHKMSDGEFQAEIANLGGTPKEFFEHPELMEYLLPILNNNFIYPDIFCVCIIRESSKCIRLGFTICVRLFCGNLFGDAFGDLSYNFGSAAQKL